MPPNRRLASQTGPAPFSLGRSPSPHSRTLACSHAAKRGLSPSFSTSPLGDIWRHSVYSTHGRHVGGIHCCSGVNA